MTILEKLKKISHKEPGIRHFCIQTIRFKKFLENARGLLDLFDDGSEKVLGEYIFDRHYVVSLIDSVVERLGMMVYDACVLVPKSGEGLYAAYDEHKFTAGNLINANGSGKSGSIALDTSGSLEPEYQLLSDVLQWFNGKDTPDEPTVMGFMKQIFLSVIQFDAIGGLEAMDVVKTRTRALLGNSGVAASDMGIYLVDLWKDAQALPKEKRSINDFNSIPLKHLLMDISGIDAKDRLNRMNKGINWVAAVSEYQLSLNSLKPDFQFRLETLASGYEQSDFIFIFADKSAILDKILPAGFHIESTDYGQFAWNLDMSAKNIEDSLMIIGRSLLS